MLSDTTLIVIYVALFVLIMAAVSLGSKSKLGVAWGFFLAALVSLVVVGVLYWCGNNCHENGWFCNYQTNCLWTLAIILLVVSLVVLLVMLWRKHRHHQHHKKNDVEEELDNMMSGSLTATMEKDKVKYSRHRELTDGSEDMKAVRTERSIKVNGGRKKPRMEQF